MAAVVDPRFEVEEYLELARYLGVRIEHVLETHTHADHVSGHGRLAEATGATIHVHRAAEAEYPHVPFEDGWELALGRLRVRAIHTPGHRPEHTAFALVDTARGEEPWAVLTGDSLFVGDVARPDLAVEREEGARALYRSLTEGLLALPPETEVWPGHLGGSMCGGPDMDQKICSTIGFELGHNPLLSESCEDGFVARALAGLGPELRRFGDIVALNRGPLLTAGVRAAPLSAGQVAHLVAEGALSSTCAPTSSSPRPTCRARSWSPTCARGSAPSWPGWPSRASRSSSSAATTPTACARRAWPRRSASAPSRAIWPAA